MNAKTTHGRPAPRHARAKGQARTTALWLAIAIRRAACDPGVQRLVRESRAARKGGSR